MAATICLNMLVSEQDTSLISSLTALKPYIDHWVLADLGLSERSAEQVEQLLDGIDGEFVDAPEDSAANIKNALLEFSRPLADYVLVLEPHMLIDVSKDLFKESLDKALYLLRVDSPVQYYEPCLIHAQHACEFVGIACETLLSKQAIAATKLDGVSVKPVCSLEQARQKGLEAMKRIEKLSATASTDPHSTFNLAKLKMKHAQWQAALDLFELFLGQQHGYGDEWQWYALYHRGKLLEKLEKPIETVIAAYLNAYEFRSRRAEPLYELARIYRAQGRQALAHMYALSAFNSGLPRQETYDLEKAIYEWHIPTEFNLSSHAQGNHAEAIDAANRALLSDTAYTMPKNAKNVLANRRQMSLTALRGKVTFPSTKPAAHNRIRLVVPFRNAGDYLRKSIDSIITQDHPNFSATFIDDCSDDDCWQHVPQQDERFNLIRNDTRVGPLVNRMNFIMSCEQDDIVVYLDGDDQLASNDVLSYIDEMYQQSGCWLSYGQFLSQHGNLGNAKPYTSQRMLIDDLESGEMRFPMHPITHRAGLFHQIQLFDPNYSCFKDDQGKWLFYASDAVLARPLFYLAGQRYIHYCDRVLYLYTEGHEISESIDNKQDQLETCRIIAQRVKPPVISDFRTTPLT